MSFQKAESNTEAVPSSVSEEQLATLTEQVKTVQSEKTALQARLTKSNDENLRLLDKIKVSIQWNQAKETFLIF